MPHSTDAHDSPAAKALEEWKSGQRETALDTLLPAASKGDDAALTLLVQLIGLPDAPALTAELAQKAVEAAPASILRNRHRAYFRASGTGSAPSWPAALAMRLDDAAEGDWQGRTELGLLALLAGEEACGIAWLEEAARQGSGHAIAALLRLSIMRGAIRPAARDLGNGLARSGHPLGQGLLSQCAGLPVDEAVFSGPVDPGETLAAIAAGIAPKPHGEQTLSDRPRIRQWDKALPAPLCDYLTVAAAPLLRPAEIINPRTGQMEADPYRSSLTAAIPEHVMDLVLWAVKSRMAALADRLPAHGEPISVIVYRPGEEYRAHFDFITGSQDTAGNGPGRRGQRVATSLIRLNDEFRGGDTVFPRLDITWTGKSGSALSFDNVDADGKGDKRTLHAGKPVTEGVKVLASLWLRERP